MTHPGEQITDYLHAYGWTQQELARRANLLPKTVSMICNGKARITAATAIALERAFRRPASFWVSLQGQYDLWLARDKMRNK